MYCIRLRSDLISILIYYPDETYDDIYTENDNKHVLLNIMSL